MPTLPDAIDQRTQWWAQHTVVLEDPTGGADRLLLLRSLDCAPEWVDAAEAHAEITEGDCFGAAQVGMHVSAAPTVWLAAPGCRPDGLDRRVHVPGVEDSPFEACTTGAELWDAMVRFAGATGTPWRFSGAVTSDLILHQLGRRPGSKAFNGAVEWPAPLLPGRNRPAEAREAPSIMYARTPTPREARARYAHAFDVNGQFLAAASSLALPVGAPVHWTPPGDPEPVIGLSGRPGIWRVGPSPNPNDWLPHPLGARMRQDGTLWVTSPTLALLQQLPGAPDVLEGYYWPTARPALRPWYETLRDARQILSGPPLEAVKATYTAGVGRMGSTARTRGLDDPLWNPYAMQAIWAEARTRWWRRLSRCAEPPVAINVDAAVWLTNSPDPAAFAKRIGLADSIGPGQLGGIKHYGTARARIVADAIIGATTPGPTTARRVFDLIRG